MSIRFFLKDSFFYGGLSLLNRSVALLLFPVLVRTLSKEEYAIVDSFTVLSGFIFVFTLMGIDSAVARFLADSKSEFDKKQIFSQSILCLVINIITFLPVIYLFNNYILHYYIGVSSYNFLFPIILLNLSFHLIIHNFLGLFKWMFEKLNYFLISFGHSVFTILLTLYLLNTLDLGIESVFYGQLISTIIFVLLSLVLGSKYMNYKIKKLSLLKFYEFGFPVLLVSSLGCIIPILERIMISQYLALEDIAIFSVSLKVVLFLTLVTNTFNTAWTPYALSIFKQEHAENTFNKILILTLSIIGLLILLLYSFSKELVVLLAGLKYTGSVTLVLPLLLSRFFIFYSLFISIGIFIKKKNKYLIIPKLIYITCFIVIAPSFVSKNGLLGLCKITLICSLISFITHLYLNAKISDFNFKYKYFIPFFLISFYSIVR